MKLSSLIVMGAVAMAMAGLPAVASSSSCVDLDGDGYLGGSGCAEATDCEDRAWQRHPGAIEICDGLDNDCDGELDEGCARECPDAVKAPVRERFALDPSLPNIWVRTVRTDVGTLVVAGVSPSPGNVYLIAQARDVDNVPLGPWHAIGEPEIENPYEELPMLASSGDRVLIVYKDNRFRERSLRRLKARVVDAFGAPVHEEVLDLSSTVAVLPHQSDAPWDHQAAVWNGEYFAVFWNGPTGRSKLWMTSVRHEGTLPQDPTVLVSDSVNGEPENLNGIAAMWTGEHHLVAVVAEVAGSDLFTMLVSRDGTLLQQEYLPLNSSDWLHFSRCQSGACLLWESGEFSSVYRLSLTFLDLQGRIDPLRGTLVVDEQEEVQTYAHFSAWNGGDIIGVAAFNSRGPSIPSFVYEWKFWRVRTDGVLLDQDPVVLEQGYPIQEMQSFEWDGRDFRAYGFFEPGTIALRKVICDCSDADLDGYSACGPGDCDDGDPHAFPFAPEICRGGADENCDRVKDCDDEVACFAAGSTEAITDLEFAETGLVWTAQADHERFDVARGLISDLLRRGDFYFADCAGFELTEPEWIDDGRAPPTGDGLWYLVRPEESPCVLGPWGLPTHERDTEVCR